MWLRFGCSECGSGPPVLAFAWGQRHGPVVLSEVSAVTSATVLAHVYGSGLPRLRMPHQFGLRQLALGRSEGAKDGATSHLEARKLVERGGGKARSRLSGHGPSGGLGRYVVPWPCPIS
jgi:hypothetical protein